MFIVKKCLRARREVCAIMADSRSVAPALPKHSYWFDFWMFLVFDVILFLIVYFQHYFMIFLDCNSTSVYDVMLYCICVYFQPSASCPVHREPGPQLMVSPVTHRAFHIIPRHNISFCSDQSLDIYSIIFSPSALLMVLESGGVLIFSTTAQVTEGCRIYTEV
uniref:Uncharacterized protein n=1 Tax=Cyprinus carpio TaxID=7962 RepID=A0A8C1RJH2_CYPCA